ncbi:alanine--tRNA ligase [Candidatus Parcubacteria bacterium]|nr:alanine--tRNA ligase [Candidatus Parcubacteria bacterium]
MNSDKLRKNFLDFFKKRKHKIVSSSSLLPSDSTVLFTTAGMQQFSLYLSGEKDVLKDFKTRHLANCQKCFRSDDIEEIGDDTHNTFFEMLGNWSIGQDEKGHYFKQGTIKYALEFLINELKLDKNKFYITIFKGNEEIPKDEESIKIWKKQGIPGERIKEFSEEDNLWGPVGETGICGPCSEIHYDRGKEFGCGDTDCGPNCSKCQRFIEIWNLVFIEYLKNKNGNYQKLSQKNVDTGMGLERVLAILENKHSAYETDLFLPIIQEIERQSSKKYENNKKYFRIIADHIRGSVFLISEGVFPSNIEQGYVLRRILRRAIRYGKIIEAGPGFLIPLANKTIEIYKDIYPEVFSKQPDILTVIQKEEEKFEKALEVGIKETNIIIVKGDITGKQAFDLYQNYGFPIEMIEEIAKEHNKKVDKQGFEKALKDHQEISRAGKEKKFGGGGKFSSKLHTATHLLHSALRQVLGDKVKQMGSDITSERLRFDFSFDRKLAKEEIKKVEDLVNQKIKQDLEVKKQEMPLEKALKSGALAFFKEKYPEKVFVYSIQVFSKEICAGPHVKRTGELGKFKIIKEESSSAGIRRIKAILEK